MKQLFMLVLLLIIYLWLLEYDKYVLGVYICYIILLVNIKWLNNCKKIKCLNNSVKVTWYCILI